MQVRTLGELAGTVGGTVYGDANTKINAAATLELAGEGDISFLANKKYEKLVRTTNASAVIVGTHMSDTKSALLIAKDPYYAFMQILEQLYGQRKHKKVGISDHASVSEDAKIGDNCAIHDFVTVEAGVKIGQGCVIYPGAYIGAGTTLGIGCILYPNAVVYENCIVGDRVIIGANSVVGQDGFGYATHKGVHHKIPHIGRVVLENDVELGASCAVERGTLGDTVIGAGTKVGDSVTIGHGTKVGKGCLLVAQVGIAGSANVGNYCVVGGQVGIVGHITVGNQVMIGAQAGVINDIPDGKIIVGAPAIEAGKAKRAYALIETLPEMRKRIKQLEKQLNLNTKELNDIS